jgi:tetratricopeptide (TPR) repeat protein
VTKIISGLAHCCRHDVHYEICWDYQGRVKFIKEYKPEDEQALRLRLFKMFPPDRLSGKASLAGKACLEARRACNEAWKAYNKAGKACNEAWKAYNEARKAYDEAWEAYKEAWEACNKAWRACLEARKACDEAWKDYKEAREAYNEAWGACLSRYSKELDALHDELFPDCTWDGKTIFTRKNDKGEWY